MDIISFSIMTFGMVGLILIAHLPPRFTLIDVAGVVIGSAMYGIAIEHLIHP